MTKQKVVRLFKRLFKDIPLSEVIAGIMTTDYGNIITYIADKPLLVKREEYVEAAKALETALADATKRAEDAEAKAREFAKNLDDYYNMAVRCVQCGHSGIHDPKCPVVKAREYLRATTKEGGE